MLGRRGAPRATFNKRTCQEAKRLLHRGTTGGDSKAPPAPKRRRAACASHASRLVKCDVLKVRPDPFESGAAPAFPSVPPTKSGEFAHFKSDRPTRWRCDGGGLVTIPGKGFGPGAHLRAGSPPVDAQGRVRFAHRTLSLHGTLPEVPLWNKGKLRRDCAEAVEFAGFLWKEKEKQEENATFALG